MIQLINPTISNEKNRVNIFLVVLLSINSLIISFPIYAEASDSLAKTEFIFIPPGEFTINNSYYFKFQTGAKCPVQDDNCRLKVSISGFSIAKYPVTRKKWESIFGKIKFSPWEKKEAPECPDCYASSFKYEDALDFIKELSKRETGKADSYRLPTESEMIYLLSSCVSECGEIISVSSQISFKLSGLYKNKFGFPMDVAKPNYYFWTEDSGSNYFLGDILSNPNAKKPPYLNPSPTASSQFNYGKMMLSFFLENDESYFRINRLGFSKNMIPDEKEIIILFVKKEK
jgi:hypothetical protein